VLKGEYFLTDTISVMIEHGAKVRTNEIQTWLDTGTIEATLDTNKIMLDQGKGNKTSNELNGDVEIIAPSFVHPSAQISNSVIGPYASIGADCKIADSKIMESILEAGCEIDSAALCRSLIGKQATVQGKGDGHFIQLNVGDNSEVAFAELDG
jgi:glucose-1-phosphate thymidylyltransferase